MRRVLVVEPVPAHDGWHPWSVFPHERQPGPFDLDTRRRLEVAYAALFTAVVGRIADVLERRHGSADGGFLEITRRVTIPFLHFFLDRWMRLDRARQDAGTDFIATANYPWQPMRCEEFDGLAQTSARFNQAFLCRIGLLRSASLVETPFEIARPSESFSRDNFNFSGASVLQKVRRKGLACASRLISGPIPARTTGYDGNPLVERGFFLRYLHHHPPLPLVAAPPEPPLREALREALDVTPPLRTLLSIGCARDVPDVTTVNDALGVWLSEMYPTEHLEAAGQNLAAGIERLKPHRKHPLVMVGGPSDSDVFLMAAAKALGMLRVGWQHGLHYGFTDDMVTVQELEYPFLDVFGTWGWTATPKHPTPVHVALTPVPSPWLSERSRRFRTDQPSLGAREFDVLLMTDKFQRFPPTSTGAGLVRSDALCSVAAAMTRLVKTAEDHGVRILHKPYDIAARRMLGHTIAALESECSASYRCIHQPHKGLNEALLRRCHLVMWDQPSTGFAECLVAGIPTIVWWPRSYYTESARAEETFDALQRVGVVHASEVAAIESVVDYCRNPGAWRANPERRKAIDRFCRQFCAVSDDWPLRWRDFLSAIQLRTRDRTRSTWSM